MFFKILESFTDIDTEKATGTGKGTERETGTEKETEKDILF